MRRFIAPHKRQLWVRELHGNKLSILGLRDPLHYVVIVWMLPNVLSRRCFERAKSSRSINEHLHGWKCS